MRNIYKVLASCFCLAAILTAGSSTIAKAAQPAPANTVTVWGPVTKTASQSLSLNNQAPDSYTGEMIINISDQTRILDAVTGFPVSFDQIRDGETVYAYISQAMTMSLPPMTNASLILCNIPADYRVPQYLQTTSLTIQADGVSGSLTANDGITYTISADCQIIPYLTRNIVTIHDLTEGRTFLLWADSQNRASKIMVFPGDGTTDLIKTGWAQIDGQWYYYDNTGNLFTGWLLDGGDWYYLNPADGMMQTGFLTLDGKTYYLQEDGRMLTKAKTFTPDESGALH